MFYVFQKFRIDFLRADLFLYFSIKIVQQAMSKEEDNKHNELNEPAGEYKSGNITFFKSFEEMNEYDHKYFASLSYNERLGQLNSMLKIFYRDALDANPSLGTKIHFD